MKTGKKIFRIQFFALCMFAVCVLITGKVYSQTNIDSAYIGKKISEIVIMGNSITKDYVILREMKTKEGDLLDPELLERDRKRIQSLQIFNRVSFQVIEENQNVNLFIFITEMWYIYPFPIFFINEHDWNKISWGAGLKHLNYRGRAEKLYLTFWLGYNPTLSIKFRTPWFLSKQDLYAGLNIDYSHVRNKHFFSENITEDHIKVAGSLGRRLGYHMFVSTTIGYEEVSVAPEYSYCLNSNSDTDQIPFMLLNFNWDHRDLIEFPTSGFYLSLTGIKSGLPKFPVDYSRFILDSRVYIPLLRSSTLALRTASTFSFGKVPLYDRVYFGYEERVRGYFSKKFEGENRVLFSSSLRFPLIPLRYYNVGDLAELQNLKFGISGSIFMDSGYIWNQGDTFDGSNLNTGFGVGLLFHLPIINIVRLEYAFDEKGRAEYILDLYVYI